jgi:hypothetical protein
MISVENLYWVLYQNLLKPSGIDCWYHFPFGTLDNLSRSEFQHCGSRNKPHVLFYDQEPMWNHSLGPHYDSDLAAWSRNPIKILANSERSDLKLAICRDRTLLDWYYFFHGFAALDWFRDSRYINDTKDIEHVFLCLNHLVRHERSYRISLLARLVHQDILHHGIVSFHGSTDDCKKELEDPHTKIPKACQSLIEHSLMHKHDLPLLVDQSSMDGSASAHFGHQEHSLWQQSFLHIVNETVFYEPKLHLTEKIFKPIISSRPFLLVSAPGNLQYLKNYGFQTFDRWWDESYDRIQDPSARLDAISQQLTDVCRKPRAQLLEMFKDMRSVLEHNKKHFFGEFRKIIVEELVDNFEHCLNQWNNGRVNGRRIMARADFESVKRILLHQSR